jgi:hypothetical protein
VMTRMTTTAATVLSSLLLLLVVLVAPADAQEPSDASASALVRVAHLSPDTPGVDVYVDGEPVVSNMGFEVVSDYLVLAPGPHRLEVRPSGAAASTPAALAQDVTLEAGTAYTVAGVGPRATLQLRVFQDDLRTPAPGQANVRVLHGATEPATVDLVTTAGQAIVAGAASAAATPYTGVAAGTYDLVLRDPATGATVVTVPPIELGAGISYTLAVVGGGDQPARLLPVVDARAAAVAPVGALATGFGGLADDGADGGPSPALAVAAVLTSLGAVAVGGATVRAIRLRAVPTR